MLTVVYASLTIGIKEHGLTAIEGIFVFTNYSRMCNLDHDHHVQDGRILRHKVPSVHQKLKYKRSNLNLNDSEQPEFDTLPDQLLKSGYDIDNMVELFKQDEDDLEQAIEDDAGDVEKRTFRRHHIHHVKGQVPEVCSCQTKVCKKMNSTF